MIRKKNENADLKILYPKVLRRSSALTSLLLVMLGVFLPGFEARSQVTQAPEPLVVQEIPITNQTKRPPPPPRPAVPIETEDADVPDDVTIAETDLDFDAPVVDLPPPVEDGDFKAEEEILEFWAVEEKPKIIQTVNPTYPEMARRAGLQGQVVVTFTVTADGQVVEPRVLKGAEIFRVSALEAVLQFRFKPAMQNDKAVSVRMTIPLSFKLH